ncbi:hypothetical protein AK812_SmicGene32112 [Symbiodinium microadriaticum]|uniref:Uncharacterized protein n=1 Tax=Symbiodinium microadriaticum TaxID=2951 RepID=A0A1Q9CV40_SYMMI|nr:hypothetical protein AK812_SmicGene32112 [Symbiodinium microadriaticum]
MWCFDPLVHACGVSDVQDEEIGERGCRVQPGCVGQGLRHGCNISKGHGEAMCFLSVAAGYLNNRGLLQNRRNQDGTNLYLPTLGSDTPNNRSSVEKSLPAPVSLPCTYSLCNSSPTRAFTDTRAALCRHLLRLERWRLLALVVL